MLRLQRFNMINAHLKGPGGLQSLSIIVSLSEIPLTFGLFKVECGSDAILVIPRRNSFHRILQLWLFTIFVIALSLLRGRLFGYFHISFSLAIGW